MFLEILIKLEMVLLKTNKLCLHLHIKSNIMKFLAEIKVMPHKELLDPQGKAVNNGLHKMDLNAIQNVRIGKLIELHIEADNSVEAERQTKEACEKLLVNKIMEQYTYTLAQLEA